MAWAAVPDEGHPAADIARQGRGEVVEADGVHRAQCTGPQAEGGAGVVRSGGAFADLDVPSVGLETHGGGETLDTGAHDDRFSGHIAKLLHS